MKEQGPHQATGLGQKYVRKAGEVIRNLVLGKGWSEPSHGTPPVHTPSEDSCASPLRNETETNPRTAFRPKPARHGLERCPRHSLVSTNHLGASDLSLPHHGEAGCSWIHSTL